jgi:hypothetical protein
VNCACCACCNQRAVSAPPAAPYAVATVLSSDPPGSLDRSDPARPGTTTTQTLYLDGNSASGAGRIGVARHATAQNHRRDWAKKQTAHDSPAKHAHQNAYPPRSNEGRVLRRRNTRPDRAVLSATEVEPSALQRLPVDEARHFDMAGVDRHLNNDLVQADDSDHRLAQPHRRTAPLVRRLGSPAGIILAGLCMLLPFISASCGTEQRSGAQWRVTYTGVDVLARRRPTVAFTDDATKQPMHTLDDTELRRLLGKPPPPLPPQPLAWLAVALMATALAATTLPAPRWRITGTAGLTLAAGVLLWGATMFALQDAKDAMVRELGQSNMSPSKPPPTVRDLRNWEQDNPKARDLVHYEYGLWIAIATLSAVGVANTLRVLRDPIYGRNGPAAGTPQP